MGLDIKKLGAEFKSTINWMITNRYAQRIKDDIQLFQQNKNKLTLNPDSSEALRMIVELLATGGYRLHKPINFDVEMSSFIIKYGTHLRTLEAAKELVSIVGKKKEDNIKQLLSYPTIKEFTENLYKLANQGKTMVFGKKGRDNYLRDFGYWDRIPIDRHETRFIIRSGIFHSCSLKERSDPLEYDHLQNALTIFCNKYLKEFIVEGIDLGDAPGIVDLFIWSYCAEDRYNICRNIPQCGICRLSSVCLLSS